jgi:POT family proton-dependent oligopeptide transporter
MTHPQGLSTLFLTEMWERFSYYGMRALLVLYLVNALEIPREHALEVYATYTALVYLTPMVGGYLADRWLGHRRTVVIGALVMALGHFAMAFPALLYYALGLLVAGNGLFKPNISTMLGNLYGEGDPRRDGGFTIFYMGINLGAFLAPLVTGTLAELFDWHYGFGAAGVGMLLGLGVFLHGQGRLQQPGLTARDWNLIVSVVLAVVLAVFAVVNLWANVHEAWQGLSLAARALLVILLLVALAYLPRIIESLSKGQTVRRHPPLSREEWQRIAAIVIIAFFVLVFWMGFEQAGGTMNLFADQKTDRHLFGREFPASYYQSLNPLLILLLAPLLSRLWFVWDRSRHAVSVVSKQGMGMLILGLGFVLMAVADQRADLIGKVGPLWLVGVYFLHTVGELFLSPIGLSMVTKLAPAHLVAMMMGLWFSATAVASYLAGTLEAMLKGSDIPLYWFLVFTSMSAGVILILLNPLLKRLMQGRA